MTAEMARILAMVFTVWGVAVAIKAARALRSGQPYEFSMWDGGLLRVGKKLSRTGAQIKVVVGVVMALGCFALWTHLLPTLIAAYLVIAVSITSILSDLLTSA